MTERSLQVTYRKGRTVAAYLYLAPNRPEEREDRGIAGWTTDRRLLPIRQPIGRRDHGAASGST